MRDKNLTYLWGDSSYKSKKQAIKMANSRAIDFNKEYFVVIDEFGNYDPCTQQDLDTFYLGIPENKIVYSTEEGEY
jgi:hypothetical protein